MMHNVRWLAALTLAICLVSATAHAQFSVLHGFTGLDGSAPYCTPLVKGGFAYGTTVGGNLALGVVWRAATDGSSYNVLHVFDGLDGSQSYTGLITNGTSLFGVTVLGGSANSGVVFKLALDGTKFSVLHHFTGPDGDIPLGKLALVSVGGVQYLYGTTEKGGASGNGTLFRLTTGGKNFSVVHDFAGGVGGSAPHSGVILLNGKLFGTTARGGSSNLGTVYKIKPDGTAFVVTHHFLGADGEDPELGTLKTDGTQLYGTTYFGGASNSGVVFKINQSGTSYTVLHSFAGGAAGAHPNNEVVVAGGLIYGTLLTDCAFASGGIYRLTTAGTGYSILYDFGSGLDGGFPVGGLALDGGVLFGTVRSAGAHGHGTVFRL